MIDDYIWAPLLELAPDDIDAFMWMFEAELPDGTILQAYKHRGTGRYLYLDDDGRAFDELRYCRFVEVEPHLLLEEVMGAWS
jgi:hypothetical protein